MAKQKGTLNPSDIEKAAVALVTGEVRAWEEAVCFVTDRVAFQMRNLIRIFRKNYWGIFDKPTDPITKKQKIWVPLTEITTEAAVANIDVDTKDVTFRAKNEKAIGLTKLVRSLVLDQLYKMYFGEVLDASERQLAIDGTLVWKTLDADQKGRSADVRIVDLLNIYIDPTAKNIQEAYRFTERALLTEDSLAGMSGWINKDSAEATVGLSPNEERLNLKTTGGTSKLVDVYELWGKIPLWLITNKKEDKNSEEEVEGHIVVSGIDGKNPVVHLIEKNNGVRPYEEAWYSKVPGRWYGRGVAEKVMMLQLWINTITNIRINREQLTQLGLFKIRRGAGITPQTISRLSANGALLVNSMDDIEQFVMQDVPVSSFNEETNIENWSRKVTAAFESATGESLAASTTATTTAIQSRSAASRFTIVREGFGNFIERWIERQLMPRVFKKVKLEDIVPYVADEEDVQKLDEAMVNMAMALQAQALREQGKIFDEFQAVTERASALERLKNSGGERFIQLLHELKTEDYGVKVEVTNEEFDKGVMAQNLIQALQLAPEYKETILKQVFDLMGINPGKMPRNPMMTAQQGGVPMQSANPMMQLQQANAPKQNQGVRVP